MARPARKIRIGQDKLREISNAVANVLSRKPTSKHKPFGFFFEEVKREFPTWHEKYIREEANRRWSAQYSY